MNALKKLGLPKNGWYVTLHIREASTHNQGHSEKEDSRNSNPLNYKKAIIS